MPPWSSITGAAVSVVAIAAATVAAVTGKIDGEAFVAIVTAFGGIGAGGAVHAAGVNQGQPETPPSRGGPG